MDTNSQVNDFLASQEERQVTIDAIEVEYGVDYAEAVRRYDVSRRAHLNAIDYDDEPDCGDEDR